MDIIGLADIGGDDGFHTVSHSLNVQLSFLYRTPAIIIAGRVLGNLYDDEG